MLMVDYDRTCYNYHTIIRYMAYFQLHGRLSNTIKETYRDLEETIMDSDNVGSVVLVIYYSRLNHDLLYISQRM